MYLISCICTLFFIDWNSQKEISVRKKRIEFKIESQQIAIPNEEHHFGIIRGTRENVPNNLMEREENSTLGKAVFLNLLNRTINRCMQEAYYCNIVTWFCWLNNSWNQKDCFHKGGILFCRQWTFPFNFECMSGLKFKSESFWILWSINVEIIWKAFDAFFAVPIFFQNT